MLTLKQYELLMYIDRHLKSRGIPPSYDEMKDALGLKSKSGIHRLIIGLEERGFIRRLPHRARALEVLRLPENVAPSPQPSGGFVPAVIEGNFKPGMPSAPVERLPGSDSVALPLYGRIAAGLPIEALRDETETFDVPGSLLGPGDHYVLEVEGDSMIEAGILDGDHAIIERSDQAESGTIVVALIDSNEVTLKRLRRKGDSIALEPANADYETRIFGPDRVVVQGKLKALIRHY
jgi:repressor LexA